MAPVGVDFFPAATGAGLVDVAGSAVVVVLEPVAEVLVVVSSELVVVELVVDDVVVSSVGV